MGSSEALARSKLIVSVDSYPQATKSDPNGLRERIELGSPQTKR